MILVKVHEGTVALCDANLLGKTFEDEKRQLKVSEQFYGGEEKSLEEVRAILSDATNMNLVGEEVIGVALEEKIINQEDVVLIEGVPHAQVYRSE